METDSQELKPEVTAISIPPVHIVRNATVQPKFGTFQPSTSLSRLSVDLNHNLVSSAWWIQCQAPNSISSNCSALFQSLERLLQHEKSVHHIEHIQPGETSSSAISVSFGTYQLVKLLYNPKVNLDPRNVEDWLQLRKNHGHGQRKDYKGLKVKSYKCPQCDLVLSTLHRLRVHEARHTGVKPYECKFAPGSCTKRYWTSQNLRIHISRAHRKIGRENWFYCDKCPRFYRREKSLMEHSKMCLMRIFEPARASVDVGMGRNAEDGMDDDQPKEDPLGMGTTSPMVPTESHLENVKVELGEIQEMNIDIKEEGTMNRRKPCRKSAVKLEPGEILLPSTSDTGKITDSGPQGQTKRLRDPNSSIFIKLPPQGCLTCPAPGCGKEFTRHGLLRRHVQRHNATFVSCDIPGCGKQLTCQANLEAHMLTHTSQAKFKCGHCPLAFKTGHGRKQHERSQHTREFPFKCQHCGRGFVAKQRCQIHELRQHTRDKKLACSHPPCDKKFLLKYQLVEHERVHTGEKPLICIYCGRGFARYNQRVRHQRRHEAMMKRMGMVERVGQ